MPATPDLIVVEVTFAVGVDQRRTNMVGYASAGKSSGLPVQLKTRWISTTGARAVRSIAALIVLSVWCTCSRNAALRLLADDLARVSAVIVHRPGRSDDGEPQQHHQAK